MLDRVLKFFITSFLAIAGGALFHLLAPILTDFLSTEVLMTDLGIFKLTLASLLCLLAGAILGGVVGFLASPYLIRQLKRFSLWVEQQLSKMPIHDVIAGAVGLSLGIIIANLFNSFKSFESAEKEPSYGGQQQCNAVAHSSCRCSGSCRHADLCAPQKPRRG